jgi:transcriptional regulator with XRE-family HTH domain
MVHTVAKRQKQQIDSELGRLIFERREEMGLSQIEFGKQAGISQAYVSGIERGITQRPEPDVMRRLSRLTLIPYRTLLRAAGIMDSDPEYDEAQGVGAEVLIVEGMTLLITVRGGERGKPLKMSAETIQLLRALQIAQEEAAREAGQR